MFSLPSLDLFFFFSSFIQGVTIEGTLWSATGGAIIGLSTILFDYISGTSPLNVLPILVFGTVCGFLGSLIDSFLGATLQQTYWDENKKLVYHFTTKGRPKSAILLSGYNVLSNEQVNFVSLILTTTVAGWVVGPLLFS